MKPIEQVFKRKHILVYLMFLMCPLLSWTQTEAEMKAQADKLFDSEQYLEATPLYLRLLSLQPRDYNYNYRYGTCLLYNSNNKGDAIKYLFYASGDPAAPPEVFYFLGKALHLNYQFNEAIKQYTQYLEKKTKDSKVYDAEREIQMCQNGKRLMTTITDIIVLDKKEITLDKFFRIYDLKDIGGNLLVTAEFQTKIDKKNNHIPLIHFPQNPSVIYYSSYGEDGKNGKDIYVRRKLPDGTWGLPQPIPGNVNTQFDEDFPYMHPDGNYLYFSSKGHNSMGGFDVFRSKYDPESNTYGPPENMDFAISSPDDDLFYVVDSLNKEAYFSSARQSQDGKIFVYRVKVDRVPIQLAVVKGNFVSEVDPKIKKIYFEIKDYANGDVIGKFNSNDKAIYLITFPKGGKYEYVMTIEGVNKEFRSIVSIPFMKEFKPLKQKIVHKIDENGAEIVQIINLFNEEVEDPQAVIAEVIKMRSQLDVNVQEFNLEEIEQDQKNQEILNELGMGNLLLVEVSDVLNQQVKKGEDNKKLIDNINNNVNNLIVENSNEFVRLEGQIKEKVAEANKTQDPESKYILLREADALIKKQAELKRYSSELLRLNDSLSGVLSQSTSGTSAQKLADLSKQFDQLYKQGLEKEAVQLIAENKEFLLTVLNDNSTDLVQNLVDKVVKLDEEITTQKNKLDQYNKDIKDLEIEIQALQNSIYSAKKKDVPAIEAKIASKQEEIRLITEERDVVQKIIDTKTQEKFLINKQIEILQDAISNKSIVPVSKEQARRSIAETEKTNSNTLTSYVQQQIATLESQDPTLKERVVVASGLKAENIYSEYQSSTKGIMDDPNLSKEERLYKLLNNERTALKQLDKRLEEIDAKLAENKFDENLNREKQELLKYQKEINAKIAGHEEQVALLAGSQNGQLSEEDIIADIEPDYEENKAFIEGNNNLSDEEKLRALQKEDQKLLLAVNEELESVQTGLSKDPSNKQLQSKQAGLEKIKQTTENSIDARDKALAETSQPLAVNKEALITEVDETYSEDVQEIEANKKLSASEKQKALLKEDRELLSSVNNELEKVDQQLAKDPTNKELQAKKQGLQELKTDTQRFIEEKENALAVSNEPLAMNKEALITEVDETYSEDVREIEANKSLSASEKQKALLKEEQELLSSVNDELEKVDQQLTKDPTNKELQAKKQGLQEVQTETQRTIDTRKESLSQQGESTSANKEMLIKEIDENYESRVKEIESNPELSETEKQKALLHEEKQLLVSLNSEVANVNSKLAENPINKELQSKKEGLEALVADTERSIDDIENTLAGTQGANEVVTKNELVEELVKGHGERVEKIEANSAFSEQEKLKALIAEDQQLVNAAKKELLAVEKQLAKDPSNKQLQERKEVLEQIIQETEISLETKRKALSELDGSLSQNESVIKQVDPLYTKEVQAITANTKLTEEQKRSELQKRDQELIENIDDQLSSTEKKLIKEPTNESLLQEKEQLSELRSLTESKMEEREQLIQSELSEELTTENIDAKKQAYLNTIAPNHATKIQEIRNSKDPELNRLQNELKAEEALLDKLIAEENAVKKILSKDPFNKEAKIKYQLISELIADQKDKIDGLNQSMEALKSGTTNALVSTKEKEEALEELAPNYEKNIKAIETDQSLTEQEKREQLLKEEKALSEQLVTKQATLDASLQENPENQAVKRESEINSALIKENEERIANYSENAPAEVTVSDAQKKETINRVDADYFDRITTMENDQTLSERQKLEARQVEDQKLLAKIFDRLDEIDTELERNPDDENLLNEKTRLEAVAEDLEQGIALRQAQLNESESIGSVSISEKEKAIQQLDAKYASDMEVIERSQVEAKEKAQRRLTENRALLMKVNESLSLLEDKLTADPGNQQLLKQKQVLEAIRSDLEEQIQEDSQIASGTTEETFVSESMKREMINELDANYSDDITAIKENESLNESQRNEQLLERENEFMDRIAQEKMAVNEALNESPNDAELKNELRVLETLEEETQETIEALKESLNTPVISSEAERTKIITELLPDYEDQKSSIQGSVKKEVDKLNELFAVEKSLLTKLQNEEKQLKKALEKDPENESLQARLALVSAMIEEQEATIENLTKERQRAQEKEKQAQVLAKADQTYSADMQRLNSSESESKQNDLAAREVVHQERLSQQISTNEKSLSEKENPELKAQTEVLKTELAASKERENDFKNSAVDQSQPNAEEKAFVAVLREDLLQGNTSEVTADHTDLEAMKEQATILENYEKALVNEIEEQKNELAQDPSNAQVAEELNWLQDELKTVQAKRRSVMISIGELEKVAIVEESNEDPRFDDPVLNELRTKEETLQQQLTDPSLTNKEKQVLQKELAKVETQRVVQENTLIKEEIQETKSQNTENTSAVKESASVNEETQVNARVALAESKQLEQEAKDLTEAANETKSPQEKNYLLEEALIKQGQANDVMKEALVENTVEKVEQENGITTLETEADLQKQRRKYQIQVGELTRSIAEIDQQLIDAKGKERELLLQEKTQKEEQLALVQKQLDDVNTQLESRETITSTTDPKALDQSISFNEEREIASSDTYRNYSEKANEALVVEKQITNLEAQLEQERTTAKNYIAESVNDPSIENTNKVQEQAQRVKQMEVELETLKEELTNKQQIANEALPANTEEAMKMQNLVLRGIQPIQRLAVVAALVPLPASGIEINAGGANTYSAANPIPVDVKNPTGLVYRVQVGAFAKPIPQDLFKEFNPVSGEKLNNGITRYMAGYFNSSRNVVEARDKIKALGYTDAFAIAYCDGKRITLAEARILEANGQCVPKGENELIMEMAANTAVSMGLADSVKIPKVEEYTYNQAPGAVKAEPIEKHLGLFFTVQVGVFNKPATSKAVNGIQPLMTLRLPNGQIRYSTGMFNSIDEARPKKQEVIDRGIKDAFITAYYNGQRITIAEAQKLLEEQGSSILETTKMNAFESNQVQASGTGSPVVGTSTETTTVPVEVEEKRIQIVTKKTFEEFPREVLNRYNAQGSFYFDETDKRVKSAIYGSEAELPQVYYFKDDIDTVYLNIDQQEKTKVVQVVFTTSTLPGDFVDWLLRFNYRREFIQTEEGTLLKLHGVTEAKLEELENKLKLFGLVWTVEENDI